VGPEPAPEGNPKLVDLPPQLAGRLASYESGYNISVLAPRGWHCAGLEGSDGVGLYLSPNPISAKDMVASRFHIISGPFIEMWAADGDTSGRDEVAAVVSRYFPKKLQMVRDIIVNQMHQSMSNYPRGPYPHDHQILRTDTIVEVLTPPNADGLGTNGRMKPGPEPIRSAAILLPSDPPYSVVVSIRLPKSQEDLAPVILKWAENAYISEM
jgi:hypothetical protein